MTDVPERLRSAAGILGHEFADPDLLLTALTHPSRVAAADADYERLEFLGDAVLGMIVGEELYRRFPHLPEGDLTKERARLVSRATCAQVGREIGLAELVLLGPSETADGSRGMRSAIAACYEAVVAALYLDAGLDAARRFVIASLGERLESPSPGGDHPKSALQERLQARGQSPEYHTVSEEGRPHERRFTVEVSVAGTMLGSGVGESKKEAEMRAADDALARLSAGR